MKKVLVLLSMLLLSFVARAEECASNTAELRQLAGNSSLSMNWLENSKKNQLTLRMSNSGNLIRLRLTTARGEWADVTGVVCKKNAESFVARVSNINWGSAAPGIARGSKIKTINIKLPYQTLMRVSVSIMSFEFSAI